MSREAPAAVDLPRFSRWTFTWFSYYLRRFFGKNFTAVRTRAATAVPADAPVVVYTNHPSWWDPIHFMLVQRRLFPGRRMFGPVDAKALEKYGIFKKLGAFGVDLESRRGAVEFLRKGRAILAEPDAVLWITAQGRFTDVRERPVQLQPGLAHLAGSTPGLVVVPLVVEYPFWNEKHPEALSLVGRPVFVDDEPERSTAEWTEVLSRRMEEAQDELSGLATARDPAPFETLVGGRTGVGGVYDMGRRLGAWSRGKRFHAAHGEVPR